MRLIVAFLFAGMTVTPSETARAQNALPAEDANALPEIVIDTSPSLQNRMNELDRARDGVLLPKYGATSYSIDDTAIQALPQGADTPLDKVLLQAPGVSYDSAISYPNFHIRNEYANVQYRINGIQLPDGVAGLGTVLETGFVGNLNLLTGVLPAQYGLRTAGVVDITAKSEFAPGGSVGLHGGSLGTISPSFEYGGSVGTTQYFFTGRFTSNNEGLENATSAADPLHDHTNQGKFFGYVSALLGESNRLSFMTGTSVSQFQIPNVPGQTPLGNFGGPAVNSANLDESQYESFLFNILALQTSNVGFDTQTSLFSRYATAHFVPDIPGDLAFNDVASDISRRSVLNGAQFDSSYRLNDVQTLRGGVTISAEDTRVDNAVTVLPLNPSPKPETIDDSRSKLGWNIGGYIQDEWKVTNKLSVNTGLRFDQLFQFVTANQLSPRVALVYKFSDDTTIHAGYARYFTPPNQAQATPSNLGLFDNTTQQAAVAADNAVRPERSHYFDVGLDQKVFTGFDVGADVYYKLATNLLDDGQFGQAPILTQFNCARGFSEGIELKAKYQSGGFRAYANFSVNATKSKDVISNQYLFSNPTELAYIANNYHFTDDDQSISASAGASYRWSQMLFSLDGIYGSGLHTGFANLDHEQPYATFNFGLSREFETWSRDKPLTVRFDIVNLLDTVYVVRDGSGIGEFAPQYGARRGFFLSLSQKI